MGAGFPELGTVSLAELRQITSPGGLRIKRDRFFTAYHPMNVYTRAACYHQSIIESRAELENFVKQ